MKWVISAILALVVATGCTGTFPTTPSGTNDGDNVTTEESTPTGTGDEQAASAVRILPDSIRLDVDELAGMGESAQAAPGHPLETAQTEAERTLDQLDEIMERFSQINDLVTGATDVQIEDSITWDTRVSGAVAGPGGSRVANPGSGSGETRQIKVDFSAFDYDGDGTDEGSGTPTTAPVALRVWVTDADGTYQPAACGVITVLPTEDHDGAGEMITLSYARNGDGDIALIEWNQDDSDDQMLATWDEHPEGEDWGYSSFLVTHETVVGMTQKTVGSTINQSMVCATWYEGADAAAVSSYEGPYDDVVASPPGVIHYLFADNSEATWADSLEVDSSGMELLEPPDTDWFAWPDDFPATPTF